MIPVTKPELETVAIPGFKALHVPPTVGLNCEVWPIQMLAGPIKEMEGFPCIVMAVVESETQPVAVFVKINLILPAAIPVTKPELVTVALDGLAEVHVPPVVGLNWVVLPIQILFGPVMMTRGLPFMVTWLEGSEIHPWLFVNTN